MSNKSHNRAKKYLNVQVFNVYRTINIKLAKALTIADAKQYCLDNFGTFPDRVF